MKNMNPLKKRMLLRKIFVAAVIAVCCSAGGSSMSLHRPENVPEQKNRTVTLCGHIQIHGSEPHTFVGIDTDDGRQYTVQASQKVLNELRQAQGQLLLLTGIIRSETETPSSTISPFQALKDGYFLLENWEIISQEQNPMSF